MQGSGKAETSTSEKGPAQRAAGAEPKYTPAAADSAGRLTGAMPAAEGLERRDVQQLGSDSHNKALLSNTAQRYAPP